MQRNSGLPTAKHEGYVAVEHSFYFFYLIGIQCFLKALRFSVRPRAETVRAPWPRSPMAHRLGTKPQKKWKPYQNSYRRELNLYSKNLYFRLNKAFWSWKSRSIVLGLLLKLQKKYETILWSNLLSIRFVFSSTCAYLKLLKTNFSSARAIFVALAHSIYQLNYRSLIFLRQLVAIFEAISFKNGF